MFFFCQHNGLEIHSFDVVSAQNDRVVAEQKHIDISAEMQEGREVRYDVQLYRVSKF